MNIKNGNDTPSEFNDVSGGTDTTPVISEIPPGYVFTFFDSSEGCILTDIVLNIPSYACPATD